MTVLDHVAVGTRTLADGWDLFGGVLGGKWAQGGNSSGFWWGQLEFLAGPKIELITPTGGPASDFLERFLTTRGPGPHHFTFVVPDLEKALARLGTLGVEAVQVNLSDGRWRDAFLHPRDAYGFIIQIAQQTGPPPALAPPAGLPKPGLASSFVRAEHHVSDIAGATRLFREGLAGELVTSLDGPDGSATELAWPGGGRIRLVPAAQAAGEVRGSIGALVFARDGRGFSEQELSRAADLSERLGVRIRLDDAGKPVALP